MRYLLINGFVFALIGLFYLGFLYAGFMDPFRRAWNDFTVTDLCYSGLDKTARNYPNDIVLVNVGHRSRYEIAQMVDRIQNYHPRVIGFDIMFSSKADTGNNYLKAVFDRHSNYIISSRGKFETSESGIPAGNGLLQEDSGYANLAGIDKEHATVRYFYPWYNGRAAFTTAVIKKYDARLVAQLDSSRNTPLDIRYTGGGSSFLTLDYTSLTAGTADSNLLKDHIVLFGYLGAEPGTADSGVRHYTIDEDKLFTPLNDRLSGRSYPDMYGVLVHANILRMMLRQDYTKLVPVWGVWIFAFLLSWMLIPVFCNWYHTKGAWFHSFSRGLQLAVCAALVCGSLLLYQYAHIKLEPLLPVLVVLLLVDFILFYHLFGPLPGEK